MLYVPVILMSKADLLTLQMTLLMENHGLESCTIIGDTLRKADPPLLLFRLVLTADINFLHHSSLRLTLEAISLSST